MNLLQIPGISIIVLLAILLEGSSIPLKIPTKTDEISIIPRQPGFQDDDVLGFDTSSTPRLDDFIKGLNSIFNGLISLDLKNVLGGTFQFIPPRVRQGVEEIVGAVIGKPRVTVKPTLPPTSTIQTSPDPSETALDQEDETDPEERQIH